MAGFFTFPFEAFAETFLSEGALTLPTATEAAKGTATVAGAVAGAVLPSIIKKAMVSQQQKRPGSPLFNSRPSKQAKSHRSFSTYKTDTMSATAKRKSPTVEGDEVAVVPLPKRIALTAPDYFNVKLPYAFIGFNTDAGVATGVNIRTFRLNSIYDPDSGSGSLHQPMGRDAWAGIYKFYRVMETEVEIITINQQNKTETSTAKNAVLIGLEHTDDTTSTGLTQNMDAFMETKNSETHLLPGKDNSPANSNSMSFYYSPQSWDDHVHETGVEERWTPVGSNPSYVHDLAYRVFQIESTDLSAFDLQYKVHITYTVQFRELQFSVYKTRDV